MSERVYDEQVAPLLMQAARICEEHGMNLVATVEFERGKTASTRSYKLDETCAAFLLCAGADQAQGNFDALAIALKRRYGDDHGSAVLHLMEQTDE